MIIAQIGIPAGLIVPPDAKQLTELTTRAASGEAFPAHWELNGRELILYYRNLSAGQLSTAQIDLIAEYPGEYVGPASQVYRSYDSSVRTTHDPFRVTVRAK
jgi:hypothetical protein